MVSTVLYLLNKTDGSNAFVIQPQTFDGSGGVQRHTDLTLYGNGAPNWGERFDDNFYHLLENFNVPEQSGVLFVPQNEGTLGAGFGINIPLQGQTWYNRTRKQLFLNRTGTSSGWAPATSAPVVSSPTPTTLSGLPYTPVAGDMVFDSTSSTLQIYNGTAWQSPAGVTVTKLIAGTGISLSPPGGTGNVTISSTGSGTVTSVGVTGSTGLTVSGSPITTSGTISLTLGTELQGLSTLSASGILTRVGAGSYASRSIVAGSGLVVSNGSGVTGNPTISLGIVGIGNGGTGQISAAGAFAALAPAGSTGSILTMNSSGSYVGFPVGTEGQFLVAAPSSNPSIGVKWYGSSGTTFSHATNGYEKLPSGLIIQWGRFTFNGSNQTISFPTPFASQCFSVVNTQPDSVSYGYASSIASVSTTQFVFKAQPGASGSTIFWQAVGV